MGYQPFIHETCETDVLIIGGGGAALRAALTAAVHGRSVRLVTKRGLMQAGSTAMAVSELLGIGGALGHTDERDEPEIHFQDTLNAGKGFIHPSLVRVLAEEAPERIQELFDWGVPFVNEEGCLDQRLSDYATYPRSCWVKGGDTGRAILRGLLHRLEQYSVQIHESIMIFQVLENNGRLCGALGVDRETGRIILFKAGSAVLATGGAQKIYRVSLSTEEMTGDGYALSLEIGLPLVNMEFVQFGPALMRPLAMALSGPIYTLNPKICNANEEEFLSSYLPSGVQPSQVFAKKVFPFSSSDLSKYLDIAIYSELLARRGTPNSTIYYDLREKAHLLKEKIPNTYQNLSALGLDMEREMLEVSIAAQCMNGGTLIEGVHGETGLTGLFVAGEVGGGLRGPDRPGGNSLTEGQVFGYRAGAKAAEIATSIQEVPNSLLSEAERRIKGLFTLPENGMGLEEMQKEIQTLMWENALVVRRREGLERVLEELDRTITRIPLPSQEDLYKALSLYNSIRTSQAVVLSALERRESRSAHYREDYPNKGGEEWEKSHSIRLSQGELLLEDHSWDSS